MQLWSPLRPWEMSREAEDRRRGETGRGEAVVLVGTRQVSQEMVGQVDLVVSRGDLAART